MTPVTKRFVSPRKRGARETIEKNESMRCVCARVVGDTFLFEGKKILHRRGQQRRIPNLIPVLPWVRGKEQPKLLLWPDIRRHRCKVIIISETETQNAFWKRKTQSAILQVESTPVNWEWCYTAREKEEGSSKQSAENRKARPESRDRRDQRANTRRPRRACKSSRKRSWSFPALLLHKKLWL
jgi:hypothetical protein